MNKLQQKDQKELTLFQKWSYLTSHATLPWTIFIGVLSVGPIASGYKLIEQLQNNYQLKAEKIVEPHSNTTYECGSGYLSQYICEDVTEIVERGKISLHIFIDKSDKTSQDKEFAVNIDMIQYVEKGIRDFLARYPDNFQGELQNRGGLHNYDSNKPEMISKSAKELDVNSILIVKELERNIPILKERIKIRSEQEHLSDEQKNKFLQDLSKLGYSGGWDFESLTNFFLFTRTKYVTEEQKKLYSTLINKYYGEIQLHLSGDKIYGVYRGGNTNAYVTLLVLSFIVTLLYLTTLLPLSGRENIKKRLLILEYGKIQNGVSSQEELKQINEYRNVLGLQSYEDAVKLFNKLCLTPNGKVIKRKGINGLAFVKNNGNCQRIVLGKNGIYRQFGHPINDNINLLYDIEEYGFNNENFEVIDAGDLLKFQVN